MPDSIAPISTLLTSREQLLRASWEAGVAAFSARLQSFLRRPALYEQVRELLLELLALIERPATGSDDALDLTGIAEHLRRLQDHDGFGTTELVFFLFSVKDILEDAIDRAAESDAELPTLPSYRQGLEQVSSLLHRLGIVLFESDVRARDDAGHHHDALAMEYALLYERARRMAITDQLTGLYNYGFFRERMREERARAERYLRLLSLVILDIDHFKLFNDAHGHPAGNDVLRAIAGVLQGQAREVDIVARYGGEELVVVLPEATRREASAMAERIRAAVAALVVPGMETQPAGHLTLSAGVATYPVDAADDTELIERADQSLYRAKREGRDRVVSYEPPHQVRLTYRPHRPVGSVALVGSFNNWDQLYDRMQLRDDGAYEFMIRLSPGSYQYKFVLDGSEWIPDPTCPERTDDGLGGDNSVLRVVI